MNSWPQVSSLTSGGSRDDLWYHRGMEEHTYLILPCGAIVWDPDEDDYATAREEERDLEYDFD